MRSLVVALVAVLVALACAAPAEASCRPSEPVSDNAARAVAVVYGTVVGTEPGAITLRVERTLKGSVTGSLRIFVGPGRGAAPGTAVMTSIDYEAAPGSDHVLYLIRGEDGQLETNACIGSHPGPLDASEVAFFGTAAALAASATPTLSAAPRDAELAPLPLRSQWPALALLALGAVALGAVVFLRRYLA